MNEKIAESLIHQMSSQISLFVSLSLGICGGLLFLVVQVLLHNRDNEKNFIGLKAFYWWMTTFILEGASICAGALSTTSITSVTPIIYHLDFASVGNWSEAKFAGSGSLKGAALVQLALFFLGMAALLFFVFANRELIREVPRGKKK